MRSLKHHPALVLTLFLLGLLTFPLKVHSKSLQCSQTLTIKSNNPLDSVATLLERVAPLDVKLKLIKYTGDDPLEPDFFEIRAYNNMGQVVGEIYIVPDSSVAVINGQEHSIYESHITLEFDSFTPMKGKGLGTFLYLSAARFVHRIDAVLVSSSLPEDEALNAWKRMTEFGWAARVIQTKPNFKITSIPEQFYASHSFRPSFLARPQLAKLDTFLELPEDFSLFEEVSLETAE